MSRKFPMNNKKKIIFFLILLLGFFIFYTGCSNNKDERITGKVILIKPKVWNTSSYKTYSEEEMILTEKVSITFNNYTVYSIGDCTMFKDNSVRDDCFLACGLKLNKSEVCIYTSSPDECYYTIAVNNNKLDACSKVNETNKSRCYLMVGLLHGNLNACEKYTQIVRNKKEEEDKIEKCYLSAYEKHRITNCEIFKKFKKWCELNKTVNLSLFDETREILLCNATDCIIWSVINLSNGSYVIGIPKKYSSLAEYYNIHYKVYDKPLTPDDARSFIRNERIDYLILQNIPEWLFNSEKETGLEKVYSTSSCVVIKNKEVKSSPMNMLK